MGNSAPAGVEVRPCRSVDELVEAASILGFYYRRKRDAAWAEVWLENFELGRMIVASESGAIVGAIGAFRFMLAVPGPSALPAAGLALGAVLPSHRRRGIFGALMTRHLDDARQRGESLAYTIPVSEAMIRTYGFGVSSFSWRISVPRERTRFRPPFEPVGRVRHVSVPDALESFPGIYDRALAGRPGSILRSRGWWEFRTLQDPEYRRGGAGPAVRALLEIDGAAEGYAIYRLTPAATDPTTTEAVGVVEAVAASDRAEASLWRYLLDIDHVSVIRADIRIDHPLPLLLYEPRFADLRLRDNAWLRVVDVAKALAGRSYRGDDRIVLQIHDAFCEWNAGTWKVEAGAASRTSADADLALDIADLSSVFLGGLTFRALRSANRLDERTDDCAERADAIFGESSAPWCPEIF